jgi:hypothetical protein
MTDKIPFNKLKDGDFLVKGRWLFIFDHFEPGRFNINAHAFLYKALFNLNDACVDVPPFPTRGIGYYEDKYAELRYATNNERKLFMDKLKDKKYCYDEEAKIVRYNANEEGRLERG